MARRIGEPVMVRAQAGGAPGTFLWRDRVYIVREVLGHWQERRSWWAAGAARAVHGDAGTGGDRLADDLAGHDALDQEREIWRVEATAGRMFGNGIYDLARDGVIDRRIDEPGGADVSAGATGGSGTGAATATAGPGQGWHLLRVAD